jgi:hypothetical protein
MKVAQLLQQTAMRYETAVSVVLEQWTPDCGCRCPGCRPCPQCPLLQMFEALVRDEIQRHILSDSCNSGSLHDSDSGLSLSKPPV